MGLPTVQAGSGAGIGATAQLIGSENDDAEFDVQLTIPTGVVTFAEQPLIIVTFGEPFDGDQHALVFPLNFQAATYISSVVTGINTSTTGFTITSSMTALPHGTYQFKVTVD